MSFLLVKTSLQFFLSILFCSLSGTYWGLFYSLPNELISYNFSCVYACPDTLKITNVFCKQPRMTSLASHTSSFRCCSCQGLYFVSRTMAHFLGGFSNFSFFTGRFATTDRWVFLSCAENSDFREGWACSDVGFIRMLFIFLHLSCSIFFILSSFRVKIAVALL